MSDPDLPVPAPEVEGQIPFYGLAVCEDPACQHSAEWRVRPLDAPDVVLLLCDEHLPLVPAVEGSIWAIA
jgi:hypothetical protein